MEELLPVLQKYHEVDIPHCLSHQFTVHLLQKLIQYLDYHCLSWHIVVEKEYPHFYIKKQFYTLEAYRNEPFPNWDFITLYSEKPCLQ